MSGVIVVVESRTSLDDVDPILLRPTTAMSCIAADYGTRPFSDASRILWLMMVEVEEEVEAVKSILIGIDLASNCHSNSVFKNLVVTLLCSFVHNHYKQASRPGLLAHVLP